MINSLRLTVSSPNKAFAHTVLGDSAIKIGRSLKCEFSIPLEDLSREHCLFEVKDQNFFITDLGSRNGVTINRKKIEPHTMVQVDPNAYIVLANMYTLELLRVEVKSKQDISVSSPEEHNPAMPIPKKSRPEKGTISFQLEYPDEKDTSLLSKLTQKRLHREENIKEVDEIENEGTSYENLKMIIGFIVATGFVIFHFLN